MKNQGQFGGTRFQSLCLIIVIQKWLEPASWPLTEDLMKLMWVTLSFLESILAPPSRNLISNEASLYFTISNFSGFFQTSIKILIWERNFGNFEDLFTMNKDDLYLWSNEKKIKIKAKDLKLTYVTFWNLLNVKY